MIVDLQSWHFDPTVDQLLELFILAKNGYTDRDCIIIRLNWGLEAKIKDKPNPALCAQYRLTMLHLNKFRSRFSNGDVLPRPAIDMWEALSGLIAPDTRPDETFDRGRERQRAKEQATIEALSVALIKVLTAEHRWYVKTAKQHVAHLLMQAEFWPRKGHVSKQGLPAVESWWKNKGDWEPDSDRKLRYDSTVRELAPESADLKVKVLENVIRSCCMSRALAREWQHEI